MALFWPRQPRRFRDLLEPAVLRDPRLDSHLYANVTRIVPARSGRAIESIEVRTITGRTYIVRPNVVVLACGGIENARLLLASATDGRSAIGNERGVVGRFYMDHPKGQSGVVSVDPTTPSLPHPAYWDDRPGRFRFGVRLSSERQRREELLDGYVRFHPVLAGRERGVGALRELRRDPGKALRHPAVMRDLVLGSPELVRFARFKAVNRGNVQTAEIHSFIEQVPKPENRVTLSDRRDLFGNPLPRLEWSVGELERRTMRRLHSLLEQDLSHRGFGSIDSPLLTGDDEPWPISRDASHHMGTTRMGDDPSTSVVDRNCQVHGLSNLYVAGSSLFPASGSANPTLTIVALALRLADHLTEPT